MTNRSLDTSDEIDRMQWERIRAMTPQQRMAKVAELTQMVQEVAFAGLRRQYPAADDREIWLRLAIRYFGADVVRKVYGFEADD